MSSNPETQNLEYKEYKKRYDARFPKPRGDPRGVVATKIDRIKQLRNKLVGINVNDDNRQEVLDDLFAIGLMSKTLRDNYRDDKKKGRTDATQQYENASVYKIALWGGGAGEFKSKVSSKTNKELTDNLVPDNPLVNKKFTDMTYVSTTESVMTPSTTVEVGTEPPLTPRTDFGEEEEEKEEVKEAPKDIVEGDEGVISVKTEVEIPATIDEDAVYVSEKAEETLEVPTSAPEERKEEEPPAPPPLPTATEDATPLPSESSPMTTPDVSVGAISDEDIAPEITPAEVSPPSGGDNQPTAIPSNTTTQEFEVEAGTRTQPTLEGVLGGIDRGVLSSISTSRREGLSINKLKEDIKDFHKIYNNVIPAFKDKAHQKRKEKALKSKNKREVLQHYEEMENLIANYYKNDGGFKLGVIVSAESLFSGNIFGGSDLYATGMVGANTGATPIDRNSLERGGSTKYNKVVDIEPTYTRGGIDHALQKPVQNKEPKVKKGRVRFDRNISTIPVAVHRPYQHILNRPLKPSYDIKIKGKK